MRLIETTLQEYIEAVDSISPAPGGGSVSSLVGSLGVALARMLGHFSIDKKRFKEASKIKQNRFILAFKELATIRDTLDHGIDADAISYTSVVDAYKSKDPVAIEEALNASAFTALEICENAKHALLLCNELVELGNRNVMSDLLSASILLEACVKTSSLNVIANANCMGDEDSKNYYLDKAKEVVETAKKLAKKVENKIMKL